MRNHAVAVAMIGVLVTSACSSLSPSNPVELIPPRFRLREVAGQRLPHRHLEKVPLNLLVDVYNDSSEEIVLRRVVLQAAPTSMSAIRFEPSQRIFDQVIPPQGVTTVDLWLTAWVELPNLDAGSRMTIRGSATFDSAVGGFTKVFMLPVLPERTGDPGE